ncbi:MAG: AbrB/MazE/SpoVT family DNA-binding domain-containing protein, partial [Geodermatophilaceae bacterium]
MRTTIDRLGRLVIPKSIRDELGLAGGGEVDI